MSQGEYLLAHQPSELERLQLQAQGMGARREWVGPSGGVVGTDIDERLLEAARSFVISENAAVPVTPLPTNNTDHTFDMPDWQPIPVP